MNHKSNIAGIVGLVLASLACIIALLSWGRGAASSIKGVSEELRQLQAHMSELRKDITSLTNSVAVLQAQRQRMAIQNVAGDAGKGNVGEVSGTLNLMDDALSRLENIVDTTGLELLATNENVDPALLREMYNDFAEQKRVEVALDQLRQRNEEFHNADKAKYDKELGELYEKARMSWRRGREGGEQEQEEAFKKMVEKYPDAYATGMVIAEHAMRSLMRENTADAEKYYTQLTGNDSFSDVVTDWGIEAVPMIQYHLAERYIEEGRVDAAQPLLDSLEKKYPQSYVFTGGRGRGRGPRMQPAAEAAASLRQRPSQTQ